MWCGSLGAPCNLCPSNPLKYGERRQLLEQLRPVPGEARRSAPAALGVLGDRCKAKPLAVSGVAGRVRAL